MYDVIVVGGGHNGLACAAYLARAGKRVLVLEAEPIVGGFCTTRELLPNAPGFRFNRAAIDHYLVNISPSVVDELGLARFGLRYLRPDPFFTYLAPDGAVVALWRDLGRTAGEIGHLSRRDAESYERLVHVLRDFVLTVLPYLRGHPRSVDARSLARIIASAVGRRRSLGTAVRLMLSSPNAVLEEWFEREEVKVAIANYALFGLGPLDAPGNPGLAFLPVAHEWGLTRPVGGSGEFTRALAEAVTAAGGKVRAGAPVARIATPDGSATGVVLETGEQLSGAAIVAALDPVTLFTRLVDDAVVPAALRTEVRGIQVLSHNVSTFKADVALTRRPAFPRHRVEDEVLANGLLVGGLDAMQRVVLDSMAGRLSHPPAVQYWLPSVFDRTLVPPGSDGETLYVSSVVAPFALEGEADWQQVKHGYLEECLDVMELHAPGVKESVTDVNVVAPADMCRRVHKGNPYHVDLLLSALGPWRPTPSLAGYRTPIAGLWHTGAGSHPTPGISGLNGRATAAALLSSLAKDDRRIPRRPVRRPPHATGRYPTDAVGSPERTGATVP